LHPGKTEQDVLFDLVNNGINANYDLIANREIMRLFKALLNVKITGDKLKNYNELRFSRFSRLLDSVIYPYSKKLNEDELVQVKGSPLDDRGDPLLFMLEPIKYLPGKLVSLMLVHGIYFFRKSVAIDSLDEPVELVLCYLDALIEKCNALLHFNPSTDPEVFDDQEYMPAPHVKYDLKKDPRYENFSLVVEAL